MGIFSGLTNMVDMVSAAPGLIESAQRLRASTEAQAANGGFGQNYVNAINEQQFGTPSAEALEPIAGVTIEQYCAVTKGIAKYNYDANMLELVAAGIGISSENWATAQAGWGARIQHDRAVGTYFNKIYTAL